MTHHIGELVGEFPDAVDRILELESTNPRFSDLADAYDETMDALQQLECRLDLVASEEECARLHRREVELLQELCTLLVS
jgi:uncharacterized protein YdcH (DUF465 family)